VKPGGRLVYITCSVFEAENISQIDAFLSRSPDFGPLDHQSLWSGKFPARAEAARFLSPGILLSPARSGTDGFFFAALSRAAQ
jgi:16S rRNA (cytosine967-C5)-methyltransferase